MTAQRLVPLIGILAVAAVVAAFAVGGETPDIDDPLREVVSFYKENDSDQAAAGLILGLGAVFFLCFLASLWPVLRGAEGERRGPSVLAFAGGIVFAIGLLIFAGLSFTLGDAADDLSPSGIQTLHVLSMEFFLPLAVGNLTFLLGTGISVVRTAVLPKWLGWVAIVGAVFQFTPLWFIPFLALALLIVVSSLLMSLRAKTA
jgi:hypothetical protein